MKTHRYVIQYECGYQNFEYI
uniref:Uncharacterized protein n=1 Tax=Anguilla anguilla TaxID=7936 RepID=A0A0E9PVR9_ANGAN